MAEEKEIKVSKKTKSVPAAPAVPKTLEEEFLLQHYELKEENRKLKDYVKVLQNQIVEMRSQKEKAGKHFYFNKHDTDAHPYLQFRESIEEPDTVYSTFVSGSENKWVQHLCDYFDIKIPNDPRKQKSKEE